ncbi:3-ketoacyl-CoA synthase 4 [Elaeis guineensis]|uniref:3-ketoacyl-CoA synthase n=1 Tax=Elaeis guineensis var. tenera TaxID=51953 RepID=A0A6I9RLP4_ELAGV|nr:3-ketoacyl-CoA synthase 4 [Elaeis guineensis]
MRSTIQFLRISMFTLLALTIIIHTMIPSIPSSLLNPDALLFLFEHKVVLLSLLWCATVAIVAYLSTRPLPVFLLDYTCFKPDNDRRCSLEVCEYVGLRSRRFSPTSQEFMRAIYRKSGLGDETYAPPFLFQTDYGAQFRHAILEAEEGMFSAVASLLAKTAVEPSRITLLITACSMFAPSPSFSSFIVHRFKLAPSVKTFNLAGMGCSAGTMSIDLAAKILRRRVGYALIVVTESTSLNWYFGDNRHMLVTNCIFRAGTAAALVTSDPSRLGAAKMELVRTLRTHHGADDAAYNAAVQMEDEDGNVGVALTKDLVRVAGAGLKGHISTLAPRVLPVSELLRYVYNVTRSIMAGDRKAVHVPAFTKAFEHMCIHAGGKAVIDAVGKIMRFDHGVTEPARMCLHRFGNTSSSLVFYELAYFEAKGRVKKGDRVWMLAFGTGFKACSVVWRALRDSGMDPDNPWKECIHRYPVV